MLTSEETERSNQKIMAELPKDVRFWYYHSIISYNTTHEPMMRPYLVKAAAEGKWMGVCPNLCSIVEFYQPMTSPQFVTGRMNEFVDKKFAGVLGFPAPLISFVKFPIEGEAEWSWNSKGRTPHEFAYSYAVRHGYRDPALVRRVDRHGRPSLLGRLRLRVAVRRDARRARKPSPAAQEGHAGRPRLHTVGDLQHSVG